MITLTKIGGDVEVARTGHDTYYYPRSGVSREIQYNNSNDTVDITIGRITEAAVALSNLTIAGVTPTNKSQFDTQWALVFPEAGATALTTVTHGSTLTGDGAGTPLDVLLDATHRLTTDAEKATWNAKQAALGFTAVPNTRQVNGHALSADVTVSKSDVLLGSADNTSDVNKPVSTAQAAADALNLKIASNLSDLAAITTARVNLGIDKRTTVADAAYTILATDKYVALTSITASRIFTLPAANAVSAGYEIIVLDESGSLTTSITLTIQRAGSDTIDGGTSEVVTSAYGFRRFVSNGSSKWTFDGGTVRLNATQTLTNKAVTKRVTTIASSATPSPSAATDDQFVITALAVAAAFASPGAGTDGQEMFLFVISDSSAHNLTYDAIYAASPDLPFPSSTIASKGTMMKIRYMTAVSKWYLTAKLEYLP